MNVFERDYSKDSILNAVPAFYHLFPVEPASTLEVICNDWLEMKIVRVHYHMSYFYELQILQVIMPEDNVLEIICNNHYSKCNQ